MNLPNIKSPCRITGPKLNLYLLMLFVHKRSTSITEGSFYTATFITSSSLFPLSIVMHSIKNKKLNRFLIKSETWMWRLGLPFTFQLETANLSFIIHMQADRGLNYVLFYMKYIYYLPFWRSLEQASRRAPAMTTTDVVPSPASMSCALESSTN